LLLLKLRRNTMMMIADGKRFVSRYVKLPG
jgi:hypothetical protein